MTLTVRNQNVASYFRAVTVSSVEQGMLHVFPAGHTSYVFQMIMRTKFDGGPEEQQQLQPVLSGPAPALCDQKTHRVGEKRLLDSLQRSLGMNYKKSLN